ncbi:MAG: phosphate-starvation-inducible PsiE family protein, partial [Oceanicaulis sp.]
MTLCSAALRFMGMEKLSQGYSLLERSVAWLVTAGMVVVIVLALVHFARGLFDAALGVTPGWDYAAFQMLFDRVLTVVIALELSRSVQQMARGEHGLAQVRTVVLIGILAVDGVHADAVAQ